MRAATKSQRGTTLIEMSVVLLVLGIILAAVTAAFISARRTTDGIDNRLENLGEAQILMQALTKDIRTATPIPDAAGGQLPAFRYAGPDHAQFYANLNTTSVDIAPKLVDISIDRTNPTAPVLVELITDPYVLTTETPTYPDPVGDPTGYATRTKKRLVGRFTTNNDTTKPLFVYRDAQNDLAAPLGDPLKASKVLAVFIKLSVRKSTSLAVKATTLENQVRLPNVLYGITPVQT